MDDPTLEPVLHVQALAALRRINRVSLAASRVWAEVHRLHRSDGRTVRVLDLACGGGDLLAGVARRAASAGVPVELHGCDVSRVALTEAARVGGTARVDGAGRGGGPARSGGVDPSIETYELDVLRADLPTGYDLLTTSLFLHHLDRPEAVDLLRRMAEAAGAGILVQDLRRTRLGYTFAWVGLHTLTRSEVARRDGLASVRGAFTLAEATELCRDAGLREARVARAWPQRFTIRWLRA